MAPRKGGHARAKAIFGRGAKGIWARRREGPEQPLDEAEKRTGYNRKYLIRVLKRTPQPQQAKARRRRRAEYGAGVTSALIAVWDIFEQPCGQRLAPILAEQVESQSERAAVDLSEGAGKGSGRLGHQ